MSVSFSSGAGVAAGAAAEGTAASAQPAAAAAAAAPLRPRRQGALRPRKSAEGGIPHAIVISFLDSGIRVLLSASDGKSSQETLGLLCGDLFCEGSVLTATLMLRVVGQTYGRFFSFLVLWHLNSVNCPDQLQRLLQFFSA